jgi:hypothetical protein
MSWLCFAQRSRKPLWYTHFRMDLVLSQEPWARICTRQPSHYTLPGLRPETSEDHEPVIVKSGGRSSFSPLATIRRSSSGNGRCKGIWRFAFQPEIDPFGRGQDNWHRLGMAARTGQPSILRTNHKEKFESRQ